MLKACPDFRHAYTLNNEIYLLGFDPEQAAPKLTEIGKAQVEALHSLYQVSEDQATSYINSVTTYGKSIKAFSEQVEAYIAAHAMDEQSLSIWYAVLQLVDKIESQYARWGIGMEARAHMDIDRRRIHLRCN
jgi:regulator of RNase E activity RraB